ncbi:hypothetical protein L6164_027989 [Bauhinia variegata]|uniref:Uncharacterized protein n=1 Tax=Bauhinia variegata TaxID=167791 RepID=A0ACB9LVS4_BAUVA|nr:hypothetical protein L6164_027989 [Bauhinia variegata]
MSEIKIEIISRNCIKPSTPTPPYLETFRLSLLDQLSPNIHGNSTFFYPYNSTNDPISEFSTRSKLLRKSLSETLTRFYPLAGRLQDASTIGCNDDGAFFIEARTDSPLSDILGSPDFNRIQHLLPTSDKETVEISNGSMLLVQFTLFGCGGTTVTISLTHKIADIAAFIALIQSWTAACRGVAEVAVPELDIGGSLFPQREILGMSASVHIAAEKFKARRFIFSEFKVGELRSRIISALGKEAEFKPSRVEVVLALIWRCAISSSRSKTGSFKPSALFQAVNLRPRMDPPVPDSALGNFVWPFAVMAEEEGDLELQELVKKMRKSMKEFLEKKVNKFKGDGFGAVMEALKERGELFKKNKDILVYKCSSWCKFALLEFDFGWGNNVWMTSVNNLVSNTIALMDTQDGGVEVLVTLDEQEMDIFEQHQELLQYALRNPSIII